MSTYGTRDGCSLIAAGLRKQSAIGGYPCGGVSRSTALIVSATQNQRSETSFINGCLRNYDLNNSWNPPTSSPSGKSATSRSRVNVPPVMSLQSAHVLPILSRHVRSLTSNHSPMFCLPPTRCQPSHVLSVFSRLSSSFMFCMTLTPCRAFQVLSASSRPTSSLMFCLQPHIRSAFSRPVRCLTSYQFPHVLTAPSRPVSL